MGIIIRQGLKTSIVSYIGIAIGAINNLYLFPQYLGTEGIGLINTIYAAAIVFSPFLQFGFSVSLVKYFPVFKNREHIATLLSYSIVLPTLIYLLFFCLWPFTYELYAILFEEKATLIYDNLFWVLPLSGVLMYVTIFETFAKINFKIFIPGLIRNVIWRLIVTLIVLLIGFGFIALENVIPFYVFSWFIVLALISFYAIWQGKLKFGWEKSFFRVPEFKKMHSFSGFVMFLSMSGILIQKIDQLMVASFLGESIAGVFSLTMYFATLIEIPKRSVMSIIQPILSYSFKKDDMTQIKSIYQKSSLNLFLIGGLIFVLIWINIQDIFALIPNGNDFIPGIYVIFFYGLSKVIDMGMGCNSEILVFSKYYKFNLPLHFIFVVIVIVTNWLFIPKYGITGAALATFISVTSYNLIRFIYLWMKMKIQPFTQKTIFILLILLVLFAVGKLIQVDLNPILLILLRSFIIILFGLYAIYKFKISDDVNKFIDTVLYKFRN